MTAHFLQLFCCILCCTLASGVALLHSQSKSTSTCNTARSSLARSVLGTFILPQAKWRGYTLPVQCPLHPRRDRHRTHQAAKIHDKASHWQCGFCGKEFKSEAMLDTHMDAKHELEAHKDEDMCLADLCDVLHCDILAAHKGNPAINPYAHHAPCNTERENQLREHCREIAEACFPVEGGDKAPLMWDFFAGHICAAHTCDKARKDQLLEDVRRSKPHLRWGFGIFAGFVTLLLLVFYITVWLYFRVYVGMINEGDLGTLRPRSTNQHWWPFKKPKQY